MASSKFNICSMALTKLGKKPVSSFNDDNNTEASQICGQLWDDESALIQTVFSWRFNSTKATLAILDETPLNEWTYSYQMPSDKLNLRAVYNSSDSGAQPIFDFEIFGNKLYTDETTIIIDYQIIKEPVDWPPYFVSFAVAHMASVIAPAITDNAALATYWDQMAWGGAQDNRKGGLFGMAKDLDSKIQPPEQIGINELLGARFA